MIVKIKYYASAIFLIPLLLGGPEVCAQKNLIKGDRLFDQNKFEESVEWYKKEYDEGSGSYREEALVKLAEAYRLSNQFELAEETYMVLMKRNRREPKFIMLYALALKGSAKYAEAKVHFQDYLQKVGVDFQAEVYLASCDSAQFWLDNPVDITVREFKPVNTPGREFSPVAYNDGMLFCSSRDGGSRSLIRSGGIKDEVMLDFYYVPLDDITDHHVKVKPVKELNSPSHEGPATFSKNGKIVYFTRTVKGRVDENNEQIDILQIFKSVLTQKGWSKPENALAFVNLEYSVGHPTLSPDGNYLYYMSDKKGGFGGADIYMSVRRANGWGEPRNMGPEINTPGYELFPFMDEEGVLYFASDGHPGMGYLDIFSAKYDKDNKKWTHVTNLRPPINSIFDDFGITIDGATKKGFFSSNRHHGSGREDIYSFVYERPMEMTLDGTTLMVDNYNIFNGITFKLRNETTGQEVPMQRVGGKFTAQLLQKQEYSLVARKEGFMHNGVRISIMDRTQDEYIKIKVIPEKHPIHIKGKLMKEVVTEIEEVITDHRGNPVDTVMRYKVKKTAIKNAYVSLLKHGDMIGQHFLDNTSRYDFKLNEPLAEYLIVAENNPDYEYKEEVLPQEEEEVVTHEDEDPITEPESEQTEEELDPVIADKEETSPSVEEDIVLNETVDPEANQPSEEGMSDLAKQRKAEKTARETALQKLTADVDESTAELVEKPDLITFSGKITGEGNPLDGAMVEVLVNDQTVETTKGDGVGEFSITLAKNVNYVFKISKDSFETKNLNINTNNIVFNTLGLDVDLERSRVVPMVGQAKDQDEPLVGANVKLLTENKPVDEDITDEKGKFEFDLVENKEYNVLVNKEGYFQQEMKVDPTDVSNQGIVGMNIKLEPLVLDKPIIINNIYYDYGKASIRYIARAELDKLTYFLEANPAVSIEVSSHTDIRSSRKFNMGLSKRRARSVVHYLSNNGVKSKRIKARGYGESLPIVASAQTEREHQLNRRTEFKIIKINERLIGGNQRSNVAPTKRRNRRPDRNRIPASVDPNLQIYVQLVASKNKLPSEHQVFKMNDVIQKVGDDRYTRYVVGPFPDLEVAESTKNYMVNKGFTDSYVVYFNHGILISKREANNIMANGGN
ncbi:MAG: PD40 domain-containing protein [Bacteroidetes bacterium]|nr:PD40 domain-containing protein [Bacteroidota bacterium]